MLFLANKTKRVARTLNNKAQFKSSYIRRPRTSWSDCDHLPWLWHQWCRLGESYLLFAQSFSFNAAWMCLWRSYTACSRPWYVKEKMEDCMHHTQWWSDYGGRARTRVASMAVGWTDTRRSRRGKRGWGGAMEVCWGSNGGWSRSVAWYWP